MKLLKLMKAGQGISWKLQAESLKFQDSSWKL